MGEPSDEPNVLFRTGRPEVVVTAAARRSAGLDHWVDGTMGIHRHGGRELVVAPNGRCLSRHHLDEGGFVGGLQGAVEPIVGLPPDVDHASGGPLYEMPSGELVLVYHGECFAAGDHLDYWSFLGLAVSDDGGRTFEDLGPVVTSVLDRDDPDRPSPVDVGGGGLLVHDGWFDLYFQDRGTRSSRRHLALARAPLDEVHAAVAARRAPVLHKYHRGRYEEPGLGGRCDELLPHARYPVGWFDVAHLAQLGCVAVVYSAWVGFVGRDSRWNHVVGLSRDGIHFGRLQTLHDDALPGEMLYLTIDSGGPCQRHVCGSAFSLYAVRSGSEYRWDDAWLERYEVTFAVHPRAPRASEVAGGGRPRGRSDGEASGPVGTLAP